MEEASILLVEDESIIAMDIMTSLRSLNYNVVGTARSKNEAIKLAGKLHPDLILMDIMLAGASSGIEAAEVIKDKYQIPVVYLTALADTATLEKAKVTDPFGYILKPYDPRVLKTSIEMALYKHSVSLKLQERTQELEEEKRITDRLLKSIYPEPIINELQSKGYIEPKVHKNVTIMVTDFQDFTSIASKISPSELVNELNDLFKNFDAILAKFSLEKLRTVGDSYIVAAGVPLPDDNHAIKTVYAALELQRYLCDRAHQQALKWEMRIGIHSGSIISGVAGKTKFIFDIWGEDVDIANQLEIACPAGEVAISETTFQMVKSHFNCTELKSITLPDEKAIKAYTTRLNDNSESLLLKLLEYHG